MARMTLDDLVSQLRAAYGDGLRAVAVYGSAADNAGHTGATNVLVLADDLSLPRLRAAAAAAGAWSNAGNPAPMTMTRDEWLGSADIFPIEYTDILARHRVVFGELPLDGVRPTREHLRLQLEQEAMGGVLKLRQALLAAAGQEKRQLELLVESLPAVLVLLRALVSLHGQVPANDKLELCRQAAALGELEAAPFERVVQHVRGGKSLSPAESGEILAGYMRGLQRLVAHLDRMHTGG